MGISADNRQVLAVFDHKPIELARNAQPRDRRVGHQRKHPRVRARMRLREGTS
jgi:hypothetical protein